MLVAGDTGCCESELYAGLVGGCPCVYCNDEPVFGYIVPVMYEYVSATEDAQTVQEVTESIESCLGS